jgi:hypothetical protein
LTSREQNWPETRFVRRQADVPDFSSADSEAVTLLHAGSWLDREAARLGVSRQALIKMWIAEKLG